MDALPLVPLYTERRSPKYEKAAMRWLARYLAELAEAEALRGDHSEPRWGLLGAQQELKTSDAVILQDRDVNVRDERVRQKH